MKIFYCDGSTRGKNQKGADNIGGWGTVCFSGLDEDNLELEFFDCETNECTTNNREELKALINCLSDIILHYADEKCIIYSDSAYVVNMCNSWIDGWAANDWKNSKKQTVENLDLIQQIYNYLIMFFVRPDIRKCDGHQGNLGNEMADALATANYRRFIGFCESAGYELSDNDYEWLERKMDESR
jgi:ribonuclease HI